MKLLNIFKKEDSKTLSLKSSIQKMDKNQLSKVIGGGDDTVTPDSTTSTESGGKKGGKINGSVIIQNGN